MLNDQMIEKRYLIITHTYGTGQAQELEKYLVKNRVRQLVFIGIPFPFSNSKEGPHAFVYQDGELVKRIALKKTRGGGVLRLIYESLLTIYLVLRTGRRFDIAYCANNLNAFIGLILRKMGIAEFVIFNTVDYVPKRYENQYMNELYHWVDKTACYHVDFLWNLASVMCLERGKRGISRREAAPRIVVPMGSNFHQIKRLGYDKIERHTAVFMGHVLKKSGLQLLIDTIPLIVRIVPDFKLLVIGGGEYLEELISLAEKGNVGSYVEFTGFVKEHSKVEKLLTRCAIAVAPYVDDPDDYTRYTDQGKLKIYMACGLPLISTKIPPIALEIDQIRAGVAIDYDREQLRDALLKLLTDDVLYKEFRRNTIAFAGRFEWGKIFDRAFIATFPGDVRG